MAETATIPSPQDVYEQVFATCDEKAQLPIRQMIVLGVLAGAYIGLGGLFATVALAESDAIPYGAAQVLAGIVFSLGLVLVMIAGAELFTGNTLMIGPVLAGRVPALKAVRALAIVYAANFFGAVLLAVIAGLAGLHDAGDGALGRAAIQLADKKVEKDFITTVASGVLANMLVCLAVWLSYAGQTVTQKVLGLVLPVAAFVAAGFEHSIANMYLLPYAFITQSPMEPDTALSLIDIVANLVPATIGNVIGGGIIALSYHAAYGKVAQK